VSAGIQTLARLRVDKYPLRICRTMHKCAACGGTICDGQRYYDGGHSRRIHEACAVGIRPPAGHLAVGTDGSGMVVVNLDKDRTGHIVFSPDEARQLASIMAEKAAEADTERAAVRRGTEGTS
jgi:hypothetical protein